MSIQIIQSRPEDADTVATLVGELLQEIMAAVKDKVFDFHHDDTVARAHSWLKDGLYTVLLAYEGSEPVGFLALYQRCALHGRRVRHDSRILCPPAVSITRDRDRLAHGGKRNWAIEGVD